MQTNKTIKFLLVGLSVLLVVWLFRSYKPKTNPDQEAYTSAFEGYTPEIVERLTIEASDGTELGMVKEASGWKSEEYALDESLIDQMLNSLLKPEKVEAVALTTARHMELGVASDSARLTLMKGEEEKTVLVGMASSSGRYVRMDGNDTTYLVAALPYQMDSVLVADWIDKNLVAIPENKIKTLSVGALTLVRREDGTWVEDGKDVPLDRAGFASALTNLASLTTQGLVDEAVSETYPAAPTVKVEVSQQEGAPVTLAFYEGESNAKVTASTRIGEYVVAKSVMESFEIEESDLKPAPASTPLPELTEG